MCVRFLSAPMGRLRDIEMSGFTASVGCFGPLGPEHNMHTLNCSDLFSISFCLIEPEDGMILMDKHVHMRYRHMYACIHAWTHAKQVNTSMHGGTHAGICRNTCTPAPAHTLWAGACTHAFTNRCNHTSVGCLKRGKEA